MIDAERAPDRGSRVDVDPGSRVGHLGKEPGQDRHAQAAQLVGDPVDGDREEARVGRDHLVVALRRRVALRDGPRILLQPVVDPGQGSVERDDDPVCLARLRQREHEVAQVAHREREPGLQLVRGAGRALRELAEQDSQQLVDEEGDVALERESAVACQSLVREERGEGVVTVVRLAHGHRLRKREPPTARGS